MYDVMKDYRSRLLVWSDIVPHLPFLYETVLQCKNPVIIELGTRSGNSTCAFLAAATQVSGTVYSCDVDPVRVPSAWTSLHEWKFIQGDDLSEDVLSWMPEEADILFIDTSHDYYQTLKELEQYVPRVKAGGIVLMHDTEFDPPNIPLDGPTGAVALALDDFCEKNGQEWTNRPGCYGMGVIRA